MRITGNETLLAARDLISVATTIPLDLHGLNFLNLRIRPATPPAMAAALTGPGLYALAYRGRVAYVGSYLGRWRADGNPYAGCIVKDRWHRHMATLTCRGVDVSSPKTIVPRMRELIPGSPLLNAMGTVNDLYAGRCGYEASKMRLRFAHSFWPQFSIADEANLLDDFQYVYLQVKPDNETAERIVEIVEEAETLLIADLLPVVNDRQLPAQYRRGGIPWRPLEEWTRVEEASAAMQNALEMAA